MIFETFSEKFDEKSRFFQKNQDFERKIQIIEDFLANRLATLNACNFATTGSWAVTFLLVSHLGQHFRIFEFPVRIILLLFEFLELVVGRISRILSEITKIIENITFCLLTSNACNFATTGSQAAKMLPVSDLGQYSKYTYQVVEKNPDEKY